MAIGLIVSRKCYNVINPMANDIQSKARRIVDELAQARKVEEIVRTVAHSDGLSGSLSDLCQEVYCILLGYDAGRLVDLWESGCIPYFLVRIVVNQLRSKTSPFYYRYRRFSALSNPIDGMEFPDGGDGK